MAFGSVTLTPGLNLEQTPLLLRAGYSESSLIRFKNGLAQKYGGWTKYYPYPVAGVPRDLHAWEDLNGVLHLAVGTTTQLDVITNNILKDITPQIFISDFTPNFSTTLGSQVVTIVDPNISNVTVFDTVFFNVPVSVGGLVLDGLYQITNITGTHSYQITAPTAATATTSTDSIPVFTTVSGTETVSVALTAHGLAVGNIIVFAIPTTGNGITISGAYDVIGIIDPNNFQINANTLATASSSFSMNGGKAELVYYIALGPATLVGGGYGEGGYGEGGYGTGTSTGGSSQTGTEITAVDWTSDNWGEILVANPQGGGIYYWDPTGGFTIAQVVSSGPPFNNGIFISMSQQILIAFGSSIHQGIGYQQQPMLVQWCDVSNFFQWQVNAQTQAGNFTIPIGSRIVAGMAVANQNLIFTDLDLWGMNYIGPPDVFGFNKIGAGMGCASSHAVQQVRGNVYWMGRHNFYSYTGNGASVVYCPIFDIVFPNLNVDYIQNVRAMPNTPWNEVGWLYPSMNSTNGECDSYVKFNVVEPGAPWDYGPMQRSAWIDRTVLGMPIGASSNGIIYQHETTPDADGSPLVASFLTGWFYLDEAEDFTFIDQIYPDFKFEYGSVTNSAQIQMTFNVANYPWDTPTVYGPYTVTQATEFLSVRMRGRLISIQIQSSDIGSVWRLGSIKMRWSKSGRR